MERKLYLIRHGNTEGTERKLFYGSTDLPITQSGRQEVEAMRRRGLYPEGEAAALYTSGMLRTEQTFEAIYGERPHGRIPDLREIEIGIFEMKTFDEVLATPLGSRWLKGEMPEFDFPGGDSYEGFFRRVNRGLETLLKEDNPRVIAVLHGAVISAIMEILFSGEKKNIFDWTRARAVDMRFTSKTAWPQNIWKLRQSTRRNEKRLRLCRFFIPRYQKAPDGHPSCAHPRQSLMPPFRGANFCPRARRWIVRVGASPPANPCATVSRRQHFAPESAGGAPELAPHPPAKP